MLFARLPIAGPSRFTSCSRAIHTSHSIWYAVPPRRAVRPKDVQPVRPVQPQPELQPKTINQSGISVTNSPSAAGQPTSLRAPWPWRPVISSPNQQSTNSNQKGNTEWIEEERTVFARPFEQGRPKMYWMAAFVSGLFFTAWIILPPRVGDLPLKEGQEKHLQTPREVLLAYASSASIGIPAIIAMTFLFLPSRYITRLSQIRVRPKKQSVSSPVQERLFFRIRHAGHEMFNSTSPRAQPRDVEMSNVRIRMLAGGKVRSPYLSLEILPSKPRRAPFSYFSFDAFPYRLDFRDSPLVETTQEEVVLSLNRVEHIFGQLDPGGKFIKPVEVRDEDKKN